MSKTNVAVLNSEMHTSTLAFDNVSSLVGFVGHFIDSHNGWNRHCELIVVHRNNQVVRNRFRTLQGLLDFTNGIQVACWLFTDEGSTPDLNYMSWLDDDSIGIRYDSRKADLGNYADDVPIQDCIDLDAPGSDDDEPTPAKDAEPNEYGEYPV